MFGLFKRTPKQTEAGIRDMLFGDVPLEHWKPSNDAGDAPEPWKSFTEARLALGKGERDAAVATLRRITRMEGLEPRQFLQAWHFLRGFGVQPDAAHGKRVRGVVLEVHLDNGLDTLAAYADHTARYINYSGKILVWETTDPEMDPLIDAMLEAGQRVADVIGPWDQARRRPPPKGFVRLNMLTDSGLHFGEGPMDLLAKDAMGGPVIAVGTRLMQALIARAAGPAG